MKTIEILNGDEIIRTLECEESESNNLLNRAKLDAVVMNRDLSGDYSARFKPDPVVITEEVPSE